MINESIKKFLKKSIRYALAPFIILDCYAFRRSIGSKRFRLSLKDLYPQIKDRTVSTGFDRHYVYHTAWAARVVKEINPEFHIDISSSLYFCGILSAFVPVHFYDYRPANLGLSNLQSKKANLYNLPFQDKSVRSISCMHTIEHIGLGRYGDPIDALGDLKAIKELKRSVASGGNLIIVVPLGESPTVEFNAHRIYTYEQIMSYVADNEFTLKEFSLIPEHEEKGGLIRNADPKLIENEHYACGCFWFVRK